MRFGMHREIPARVRRATALRRWWSALTRAPFASGELGTFSRIIYIMLNLGADCGPVYSRRCVQSRHARNRHPRDRQHISKSNTSLFETPASSRRFFFFAIFL